MDSFLSLDSELIKIEVEQNTNFHCIICKAEFLNRESRNDHLETHFVHRNCEHCHKAVIIIGDLEFELHQPSHCHKSESNAYENTFESFIADELHGDDAERDSIESNETIEEQNESPPKRARNKVDYKNETDSDTPVKPKRKSARKRTKKSSQKKAAHSRIETENDISEVTGKAESESDFDAFSEIDVEKKLKRRRYSRLPKTIPCTMCDMLFGSERTVKIHMHQVHGVKERYICPICSREFKVSGNLKQHIDTHSDHKRFICSYCGKGFHLPYNLKEHINTHTGARPYKCETCGKTFGRNTLRMAHMRIHTGEKPYKCTEENCDRAYAYQTDLKRHKRSVQGIITKTFPCPICSKVFYENKFLTKHLNVHRS